MTSQEQTRRELASTGQCPFTIASLALEQNKRLQERISKLEAQLREKR